MPGQFAMAKLKLDQFFLQWLDEHQDVVRGVAWRGAAAAARCKAGGSCRARPASKGRLHTLLPSPHRSPASLRMRRRASRCGGRRPWPAGPRRCPPRPPTPSLPPRCAAWSECRTTCTACNTPCPTPCAPPRHAAPPVPVQSSVPQVPHVAPAQVPVQHLLLLVETGQSVGPGAGRRMRRRSGGGAAGQPPLPRAKRSCPRLQHPRAARCSLPRSPRSPSYHSSTSRTATSRPARAARTSRSALSSTLTRCPAASA